MSFNSRTASCEEADVRLTFPDEELPDHDKIDCLQETSGMYSADRWPATIGEQMEFMRKVGSKWGYDSAMYLVHSYDGYPGYIMVKPAL